MNATQTATLRRLESDLSAVAGVPVEITIRDAGRFTWSIEDRNDDAAAKLVAFASKYPGAKVEAQHDDECGSFVFVDVAA